MGRTSTPSSSGLGRPFHRFCGLLWNSRSAAGSTYYVQYSADPAPLWNRASAQLTGIRLPCPLARQFQRVTDLPVLRYPAGGVTTQETRGNLYKFKVWIAAAILPPSCRKCRASPGHPRPTTVQYYGRERLL